MSAEFISAMLDFRWLVILVLTIGITAAIVNSALTSHMTWTQKRINFYGIFWGMSDREFFWLSSGFLRVLFVVMISFFGVMIKPTHTVFFIGLLLLYNALRADVKMLAFDLINSALIYAALIVSNILWGFFREVQGDWKILTICILLALFLVIYMLYSYLKDISELLKQKTR